MWFILQAKCVVDAPDSSGKMALHHAGEVQKDYSVITAQLRSLSRTSNRLNLQYILSSFTSFYLVFLVQMFSTLTPQHLYSTPKHRMACHCRLFAPNCQVVRANPKKSMFLFVDRQNCSLANKKKVAPLLPCLYRRQWGKKTDFVCCC